MFELTGKVAVVTGGSRGLGRADCLTLARAGADVVVTDILLESDPEIEKSAEASQSALAQLFTSQHVVYAEQTSEEIRQMGRRSAAIKMDVTDRAHIREVFAGIKKDFGSIDILVNNAGTLDHIGQIEHQSDELWDRDLRVNLTGAFNCTKAAWPYMREQGWGRVIYMASVAGTLGGFGQASYASTKASLIGLGKSMALEGARFGITANIIAPGVIGTEAWKMGDAKMNDRMVLRTAMRSAGEPEDIANAIAFLCSPEARYITGQVLTVAGGIDLFVY
ncbi:MAG TPA: SDR family oxidoreductase [Candidatus Saccharimonadales bacterium]|jgi:3-oxoacyl-[acyl-carrier protein] reductase|nr:SDR family oxidoreductase [Candidatus Saccharimonadales bacterium]